MLNGSVRHWREAKKSNREEKYGIHFFIEKRKRNVEISGSRREPEFLETKLREICNDFSSVEKRMRNFKHFLQFREEKNKPKKIFSSFEFREGIETLKLKKMKLRVESHSSRRESDIFLLKISNIEKRKRKFFKISNFKRRKRLFSLKSWKSRN